MEHPLAQFLYCPECGSSHFEVNNEKSKNVQIAALSIISILLPPQ